MSAIAQKMERSRGALWFGVFGGAIAWLVHLMFAYVIAEFGCAGGLGDRNVLGVSPVAWMEVALTLATTLVAAAATIVAYRSHRRLQSDAAQADAALAAKQSTAWAGVLTSGLFTFIILFESIPIFYYLHRC